MKKYYVYSRYIGHGSTGREDYVGMYDNWKEAISRVTSLYNSDKKSVATRGEYYYFIKEKN